MKINLFGWFKSCKHKWTKWTITKKISSSDGQIKIIQSRECLECGYTQIKAEIA